MKLCALALSLCAVVGCEKSGPVSSGPLGAEDIALLHDVPSGNAVLFGGNYLRMQEFMNTALGGLQDRIGGSASDLAAFHTWASCFLDAGEMRIVGGGALEPTFAARFAMRGLTIDKLAACATKAGYPNTVDPDRKFIALTLPQAAGKTVRTGYLQLPDGALYMEMRIDPGPQRGIAPTTRAGLEAATANLNASSAAGDKALLDLAAKTDRSKTLWIAVNGAGTSMADRVRDAYGSIALDEQAMHVDATIHFPDAAVAKRFDDSVAQVRKLATQMRPGLKEVLDGVTLTVTGDTVHVVARTTTAQLRDLTKLTGR